MTLQDSAQFADGLPALKKDRLSIAVVCAGLSGHMIPILNICTELSKRHGVKLYCEDFFKDEFEQKIKQTGSEFVPLDMQGNTWECIKEKSTRRGRIAFLEEEEIMLPALEKEFAKSKPDVVLSDFATLAGLAAAESFNIPLVINLPGPVKILRWFLSMPDASTGIKLFGFHMTRQRLNLESFSVQMNMQGFATFGSKLQHHIGKGAVVLVQSIWGLDEAVPLYPNMVMTGPVLPPAGDLRARLAKDHAELHQFLRGSVSGAVYVTTGSHCKLHDWQVRVLYNGLKKGKFRVVWSLKEELQQFLPVTDDPDFFISKWTPQAELLQDPAVKLVISHCGWGGVLETMTAGKPVVAIPFFGDQPVNAELLRILGVAELIGRIPSITAPPGNAYKEGWMTEETVYSAVSKVMQNPSYTEAAQRLTRAAEASGGVAAAAQQVELAGRYGTSHLKPINFKHASGSNPWTGVLLALAVGACGGLWMYLKR